MNKTTCTIPRPYEVLLSKAEAGKTYTDFTTLVTNANCGNAEGTNIFI